MKDFTKGIFCAGMLGVAGKGLYELGRRHEQKKTKRLWDTVNEQMDRVLHKIKELVGEEDKEGS